MKKRIYLVFVILVFVASIAAQEKDFPELTGPYLGQKPPGMTPVIFSPGIVSTDAHEFSIAVSPEGDEIFFTRMFGEGHQKIMVTRLENGRWTKPEPMPFAEDYPCFEPGFSPDGQKLFFNYWKPIDENHPASCDIWYIERNGTGWSEPEHLGAPFNPGKSMYISVTESGTVYTTELANGFSEVYIARSKFADGRYGDFERIGPPVSIGKNDMYPCVAPDERFLIFSSERSGTDTYHLFVTVPDGKGSWEKPRLIETGLDVSVQPFLTFDQKYLFFTSKGDIYWVDAKIIEELKPEDSR